jgi:cytochrome P450
LRYTAPLPGTVRIASRDVEVDGMHFEQGARVVILTCNLARDRKVYPDPDRFDITRDCHPKFGRLWYGAGPHRCAGINLAQRELHAFLEALTGLGREIHVVERRAEKFALLPAYSRLVIQASGSRS